MVINGERPLDLAAERDPRIEIEGDVHLLMNLPTRIERTPTPRQQAGNMQQVCTVTAPASAGEKLSGQIRPYAAPCNVGRRIA